MTGGADDRQLIGDLSREVVGRLAPWELPLFEPHSRAYFANPDGVAPDEGDKARSLGFDAGQAVALITPVVLPVVAEVVGFVTREVLKSAREESPALIGDLVRRLFKGFRPAAGAEGPVVPLEPPPLTRKQLARVREIAFEKARRLELPEDRAALLADALVGGLATAGD